MIIQLIAQLFGSLGSMEINKMNMMINSPFVDNYDENFKKTVDELVQKAFSQTIEVLEKEGWCQGKMKDEAGRRCVFGALSYVCTQLGIQNPSHHSALFLTTHRIFRDFIGVDSDPVTGPCFGILWNDKENRTFEEVIAALKGAKDSVVA